MKLKDVSRRLNADFSTVHFTPETIAAVEARLKDRGGKLYVTCQIRAKEVQAKPEEIVRQLWIAALLYQYAYPRQLISVEYPVTFGRDTSKRAEIAIEESEAAALRFLTEPLEGMTT